MPTTSQTSSVDPDDAVGGEQRAVERRLREERRDDPQPARQQDGDHDRHQRRPVRGEQRPHPAAELIGRPAAAVMGSSLGTSQRVTSARPSRRPSTSTSGRVTAAGSVLIPMQHVPSCEIRVSIAAQPGSGPNGYMRVIRAPAMYDRVGHAGHVGGLHVVGRGHPARHRPEHRPGQPGQHRPQQPHRVDGRVRPRLSTNRRTAWIRAAGSVSASGPGKRAPVNRLPPCGSSSVRRLIGMPIGIVVRHRPRRAPRGSGGTRRARPRGTRRSPSRPPPSRPPSARPVPRRARRSATRRCAPPAAASPARAPGRRPARATAHATGAPSARPAATGLVSRRSASAGTARAVRADLARQHPDRVRGARHRRRGLRPQRVVLAGPAVQPRHELDRRRGRRWRSGG